MEPERCTADETGTIPCSPLSHLKADVDELREEAGGLRGEVGTLRVKVERRDRYHEEVIAFLEKIASDQVAVREAIETVRTRMDALEILDRVAADPKLAAAFASLGKQAAACPDGGTGP